MRLMGHELAAVAWHVRGGYRARCGCRWTSARYAHPEGARRSWAAHVQREAALLLAEYVRDSCRCVVCSRRINALRAIVRGPAS